MSSFCSDICSRIIYKSEILISHISEVIHLEMKCARVLPALKQHLLLDLMMQTRAPTCRKGIITLKIQNIQRVWCLTLHQIEHRVASMPRTEKQNLSKSIRICMIPPTQMYNMKVHSNVQQCKISIWYIWYSQFCKLYFNVRKQMALVFCSFN